MKRSMVKMVLAASVLLPMCASTLAASAKPSKARIDAVMAEYNRTDGPGCAVSVVQNGAVAYENGYGMANLEHQVPITPDTVFYIASVSKQFTAAAVALLAEEGRISLQDDLRKYVPEMPDYGKPIAIHNLIHHTSGLRDYLNLWDQSHQSFADSISELQAIEIIARHPGLEFPTGDKYQYSNSNYMLLSLIVKRASGMSLRQYAEEKMFKPLGMRHTHFHDDRTMIVPNRASAYFKRAAKDGGGPDGGELGLFQTSFDLVGDGGLLTTVRDLVLWDRNYYHNVLGTRGQALIEQLTSTEPLNDGSANAYAFGLQIGEYGGLKSVSHGGSFIGYRSMLMRIPQRQLSVIMLCNAAEADTGKLSKQIVDLYLGTGQKQK